jgi:hypothetical protein
VKVVLAFGRRDLHNEWLTDVYAAKVIKKVLA